MSSHVDFHGEEAKDYVQDRAEQFITRACITVKNRVQELLSISGSGRVEGVQHGPVERSKPGEPPRKQTGEGRASYTYEVEGMKGRVGTNMKKMKALELGTSRGLLPRPHLRRALAEMQTQVNSLLSQIKE